MRAVSSALVTPRAQRRTSSITPTKSWRRRSCRARSWRSTRRRLRRRPRLLALRPITRLPTRLPPWVPRQQLPRSRRHRGRVGGTWAAVALRLSTRCPGTLCPPAPPSPDSAFDVVASVVTTAARPASQCSPPLVSRSPPPDDRGPCDLDRPAPPPTPHYRPP